MTTATVIYKGNLRTECTHLASENTFITDAPVDNKGKGEAFSPTDTVATALASCMLTIMGIKARDLEVSLEGAEAHVEKIMAAQPRRISGIKVSLRLPKVDEKMQKILEKVALACPVHHSLHPDMKKEITFSWE